MKHHRVSLSPRARKELYANPSRKRQEELARLLEMANEKERRRAAFAARRVASRPGLGAGLIAGFAMAALGVAVVWLAAPPAHAETGQASYYGSESGSRTASGERFHPDAKPYTCARPSFRAGHRPYSVHVTNLENGRAIVCRVNDRGPAGWTHRVLDVSRAAAVALGFTSAGHARVSIDQ